jgi:hypothetical protein
LTLWNCQTCRGAADKKEKHFPSHDGSRACANARAGLAGAIAAGGSRSHCTCDVCW